MIEIIDAAASLHQQTPLLEKRGRAVIIFQVIQNKQS